jgi:PAS domain S-box-containing protein
MFERFHRVENARGRSHEGSGIGLALVHELVKLHGGSISVASEWGAGTAFTVAIPKGSAHLPAERVKAAPETPSSTATRAGTYVTEALGWLPAAEGIAHEGSPQGAPRILVADDNADLRDYARRLLGDHYEVHTVADGEAALDAARRLHPEVIVSDVMMPRLDGFGLIREIRADRELQAIPIILLSARAGEEARVEGLGKGADDYLVKPFNARELLVRVGALIQSTEMHRRANEARAQFETLLNAAPLGVYVVDQDFRIAAVNPMALPMFNEIPDLIGRDFASVLHMLVPRDRADEIVRLFRRTLETGERHIVPEHMRKRDPGVPEYYEWQIDRIPLPGRRRGVVCYFRDISKSVRAREALREADSRKDEFLATLSHELRNPLAPLRSSLEVLKRVGAQGQQASLAIDVMQRQLGHLVRLVDDLLEVSRITRGAVDLRKERVRLDLVLGHALETSEPLMRARNHRLNVSLPQEPIVLMADPVRLAQVFSNLLNNAAKYSDENAEITVKAWRETGEAVIAISDSGDGIEPEQLPKLFQIFMRGERGARRNQSGLGIGLALVHRLTEMHGGRVEARSEGAGKGSCFTVRLPLSVVQHVATPSAAQQEDQTIPPLRVLVIDDNRDAAASLAMLLETMGAEVRVAHDGAQGVIEYERFLPLMVLLDIGMPGMDGYEVARRLRALREHPRACIVALTGWGQDEDRRRVREAGFDHHLIKPADIGDLQALIAALQEAPGQAM